MPVQVLSIVAMLSVKNPFMRPKEAARLADEAKVGASPVFRLVATFVFTIFVDDFLVD